MLVHRGRSMSFLNRQHEFEYGRDGPGGFQPTDE